MLVLVFSQISKLKSARCPVNVCGIDCTRYWRKSKGVRRPANDCGSVCRDLTCGINL